jgi:hypothetical protein
VRRVWAPEEEARATAAAAAVALHGVGRRTMRGYKRGRRSSEGAAAQQMGSGLQGLNPGIWTYLSPTGLSAMAAVAMGVCLLSAFASCWQGPPASTTVSAGRLARPQRRWPD